MMADDSKVDPAVVAAFSAALASAGGPKVSWDVADLLDRMGTRLDQGFATLNAKLDSKADKGDLTEITTKLDLKADKTDLTQIHARLDQHGQEIGHLKDRMREDEAAEAAVQKQRDAWRDWRRWAIGVVVLMIAALPGFIALLHP